MPNIKANSEKKHQLKKIVVKSDYELTDVLALIGNTDVGRIQLTFTDFSDLLVSPINLKVIQEIADEQDKTLILQIIGNTAGIRNAKEAGLVFTDSVENINEAFWNKSENTMAKRIRKNEEMLKKASASKQTVVPVATETPKIKTKKMKLTNESTKPPNESMSATIEEMVETTKREVDVKSPNIEIKENKPKTEAITDLQNTNDIVKPIKEQSEYSKSVEQAINKSKKVIEQGGIRIVKSGSLEMALDDDIAQLQLLQKQNIEKAKKEGLPTKIQGLTGRDLLTEKENFNNPVNNNNINQNSMIAGLRTSTTQVRKVFKKFLFGISTFFKSKAGKKGLMYILIPTILTIIFGLWLTYRLSPIVKISAEITSTPISFEQSFTGDPSITEFSLENSKIRVKKEVVKKELSDNAVASGTGFRGEKAGGLVTVYCTKIGDPETLLTGTTFTAENKAYTLVNDVATPCPGTASATILATNVGEEYNIPSGSLFTIGTYAITDLSGRNDSGSLTGGSKEEYVIISQSDVEELSDALIEAANEDATGELKDYATDGWILIESTLKHDGGEDIKTDKPIGTEADLFNISLSTSSSAIYYNKGDLETVANSMLLNSAKEKNLFEGSEDIELILDSEIIKNITFKSIEGTTVNVDMTVSGSVIPKVDEQKIIDYLQGMNWAEGKKYLQGLSFFTYEPTISFTPTWIPENMWYFPSRQGRILLNVSEVETTEIIEDGK